MTGPDVIAHLGLVPLPSEGGHWAQTWIDGHGSAIYYLLQPEHFSAFHRLPRPELYHHYGGAPAELWRLHPDGTSDCCVLGLDLAGGQRPVHHVPAGVWQASRTRGPWTLLGCTMAPPYRADAFELGLRPELLAAYPQQTAEITALTRTGPV